MFKRPARFSAAIMTASLALLPFTANAQYSGTNGQIVYVKYNNGGTSSQLRAVNADGTGDRQIVASIPNPGPFLSTSKDGTSIAFDGSSNGITIAKLNGSSSAVILNSVSGDSAPVWSPDGTKIYFYSNRSPNTIDVINVDGTGRTVLVTLPSTAVLFALALTTDGTTLLAAQNSSSTPGTYTIQSYPIAGGTGTTLATITGKYLTLDTSPDGLSILYTAAVGGSTVVATMPVAGGTSTTLLTTPSAASGNKEYIGANYAPDGTKILVRQATMTSSTVDNARTDVVATFLTINIDGTAAAGSAGLTSSVAYPLGGVWTTVSNVSVSTPVQSNPTVAGVATLPKTGSPLKQSLPYLLLGLGLAGVATIEVVGRARNAKR